MTIFIERFQDIYQLTLAKAPQLLLTLLFGYILIKIVTIVLHGLIKVTRVNLAMKGILMSVINVGLWIFLISALLQQIGQSQIALALSSTTIIVGLAISTGSSAFVQDLVSGLLLAQDPDFQVGDRLCVEDVEGVIERMDARKIRMRDDKGLLHIFPNSTFDKTAWIVIQKKSKGGE